MCCQILLWLCCIHSIVLSAVSTVSANTKTSNKPSHTYVSPFVPEKCCRLCYFVKTISEHSESSTSIGGSHKHNKIEYNYFNDSALIQLKYSKTNLSKNIKHLDSCVHLSCLVFLMLLCDNPKNRTFKSCCTNKDCEIVSLDLKSNVRVELHWLCLFMKYMAHMIRKQLRKRKLSEMENEGYCCKENPKTNNIIKIEEEDLNDLVLCINGEEIKNPLECVDFKSAYNYVWKHLPASVKDYMGNDLKSFADTICVEQESEPSDSLKTLEWIFANPHKFYSVFCVYDKESYSAAINAIFNELNLARGHNFMIDKILEKVYYCPASTLFETNPLSTVLIVQLMWYHSCSKRSKIKRAKAFTNSATIFKEEQTSKNFINLIYSCVKELSYLKRSIEQRVSCIINFIDFMNESEIKNLNSRIAIINLCVAAITLLLPHNDIAYFCYILFERRLMDNISTWMVFHRSLNVKRLLIMKSGKSESLIEEELPRTINGQQWKCLFFKPKANLREEIITLICEENRIYNELQMPPSKMKWHIVNITREWFKNAYKLWTDIINKRSATDEKCCLRLINEQSSLRIEDNEEMYSQQPEIKKTRKVFGLNERTSIEP